MIFLTGMERDWPEGRGIFHNEAKTFLVWVNEEDQLRIISMEQGGDVKKVFERLAAGIEAVQKSIEEESGKKFLLDEKLGYLHSCPTNLGTGMRYEKTNNVCCLHYVCSCRIRNVLIGAKYQLLLNFGCLFTFYY